jgi:hypothetical protein
VHHSPTSISKAFDTSDVEDDKVFVYLINKVNKDLIPPNIASTVQECLTLTMKKVIEFYHKRFGKSLSTSEVSKAFEIEVGEWCTSGGGCYISVPEVKEKKTIVNVRHSCTVDAMFGGIKSLFTLFIK